MLELVVDLSEAPERRFHLDAVHRRQARELIALYKRDLGLRTNFAALLFDAAAALCAPVYWAELGALARQIELPVEDVALCNFYYDAFKAVLGCTGFAVEHEGGVLHARNLDWWTDDGLLSSATLVTRFINAPAGEFVTIGWPGFAGVLSAMAPGRFAVSLNSVLSFDRPELAQPVVFLLRSVCERATSFQEAVELLANTPIASDCLLLVSGVRAGELAVIERTPTRSALRSANSGGICVANDYLLLDASGREHSDSALRVTSCRRFERISELLAAQPPSSLEHGLVMLADREVKMDMTVQQMAFHAASGRYALRLPGVPWS